MTFYSLSLKNQYRLCIGESPSICSFLKNNGHEGPQGSSVIIFQEWTDTRAFSYLKYTLSLKYTTKFSLPKIACPAIVYAEIVVVIGPFFVSVCPWIKVYRYNPTEICQQRLQGVRNVAQKLCSWERSFNVQLCIMTSLHRLTWIIYSWCCARILKFYFFANSITLLKAHKNIKHTLHSGFKRARQTVHYFCARQTVHYICVF